MWPFRILKLVRRGEGAFMSRRAAYFGYVRRDLRRFRIPDRRPRSGRPTTPSAGGSLRRAAGRTVVVRVEVRLTFRAGDADRGPGTLLTPYLAETGWNLIGRSGPEA